MTPNQDSSFKSLEVGGGGGGEIVMLGLILIVKK